ncbi:protein of unknown function [Ruminococcaceae bacterium BL-6]|nr:protein of unknown function [Ruminococcaceae bacterium BL-6]
MIKIEGKDIDKLLGDKTNNLLLNLATGSLPEYLTKDEVELLKQRYGDDWFTELGYSEPKYKKPVFD